MNPVLDFIRDTQAGPLTRDHLVTRKELNNIKHQYNIDCVQKDGEMARVTIQFCITSLRGRNQSKRELRKMIFYWQSRRSSRKKCLTSMDLN